MKKNRWIIPALLLFTLASCQPITPGAVLPEVVSYHSNLFNCTYDLPRDWQSGPVFDSGAAGEEISDEDPIKAFGYGSRSGTEIALILLKYLEPPDGFDPVAYIEKHFKKADSSGIVEVIDNEKHYAYFFNAGSMSAVLINGQDVFVINGDYPVYKEEKMKAGVLVIINSLKSTGGSSLSLEKPILQRNEGVVTRNSPFKGSVPLWGMSAWTFSGKARQSIEISIDPGDAEAELILDILDANSQSILPEGGIAFVGKFESGPIKLPEKGNYSIQLSPSDSSRWYGWYEINVK